MYGNCLVFTCERWEVTASYLLHLSRPSASLNKPSRKVVFVYAHVENTNIIVGGEKVFPLAFSVNLYMRVGGNTT